MLAYKVADDVIRASPKEVDHPVQMAVVTSSGASLVADDELRGMEETVAAFRERQRDFLVREEPPTPESDTGIRPA